MSYRRFGLLANHRRSMMRNVVTSLLENGSITTTEMRAKDIRKVAEKMISLAKSGDLHSRRQAESYLMKSEVVYKLFNEIKDRYKDREGGYTRIIKTGYRKGDGAPMVIIELVD